MTLQHHDGSKLYGVHTKLTQTAGTANPSLIPPLRYLHRELPTTLSKASRLIFSLGVIRLKCFAPSDSAALLKDGGKQDAQPVETLLAPAPFSR